MRLMPLLCVVLLGASGCELLHPDPVTHFPVNDDEWAITVDGVAADHASAIAALHQRANEICGGGYDFRSEFHRDTLIGYVRCDRREPTLASVETRRLPRSSETPVNSQVVEKDGQRCLQGLDAAGNVIEEYCEEPHDR